MNAKETAAKPEKTWTLAKDRHGFLVAVELDSVIDDMGKLGAWAIPKGHHQMVVVRPLRSKESAHRTERRWRAAAASVLTRNPE